jgi:isopenicillin N synthase-like dioxygenase
MNERSLPVIDVSALVAGGHGDRKRAADAIGAACREHGFFYAFGHGVDPRLCADLERASRAFFARPLAEKLAIAMERGGRAWRGYFPVGAELTSGRPDQKEGIYFGSELAEDHPKVRARVPMHGRNLFPPDPAFRELVLAYLAALTSLGHSVMEGIALSLGLPARYFADRYTGDPLILFRIFHYPELPPEGELWSVGEHSDYGLLTLLYQDRSGGLQVKTRQGWLEAPPLDGSFVCNIGDMLDRMTGGHYRSTPHRVRNPARAGRISFPFFFDPGFDARVEPIDRDAVPDEDAASRWDRASVHAFSGTYGDYLLRKVYAVFPQLRDAVL